MRAGALRYLPRPVDEPAFREALATGIKTTRRNRRVQVLVEDTGSTLSPPTEELPNFDIEFETAIAGLRMIASAVVLAESPEIIVGYTVEPCSESASMRSEMSLRAAAERLGHSSHLREALLKTTRRLFDGILPQQSLFLRPPAEDLLDPAFGGSGPLAGLEQRLVIMLPPTSRVDSSSEWHERVESLRNRGVRFCCSRVRDDGSWGDFQRPRGGIRMSYACLEPSLVTMAAHFESHRTALASLLITVRQSGAQVIANGVTTIAEKEVMCQLGCELLSGPLFDAPGRETA